MQGMMGRSVLRFVKYKKSFLTLFQAFAHNLKVNKTWVYGDSLFLSILRSKVKI